MNNQGFYSSSDDVEHAQDNLKNDGKEALSEGAQWGKEALSKKSANEAAGAASAAGETAKDSAAAGSATATTGEGASAGAAAGGGSGGLVFLLIFVLVIVLVLIMMLLISYIPVGDILGTLEDLNATEIRIEETLEPIYNDAKEKAKDFILDYLEEEYPLLSISDEDIHFSNSTQKFYLFKPPTWEDPYGCDISVSFLPPFSYMVENVSAYINATNATIAYFGDDTIKELESYQAGTHSSDFFSEGTVLEQNSDKNGWILGDEAKKYYQSHSTAPTNTLHEDYITELDISSGTFFKPDSKASRWEHDNVHEEKKQLVKERTQEYCYTDRTGNTACATETKKEYKEAITYVEDITINMYYDLSHYKEQELKECLENALEYVRFAKVGMSYNAEELVWDIQNHYYNTYIADFNAIIDFESIGSSNISYRAKGEDHPREEIFAKLLADGTLSYVPIWGFTEEMIPEDGTPGYEGEISVSSEDLMTWETILLLKERGLLGDTHAADYNCTLFTQAWFYETYKEDLEKAGLTVSDLLWGDGKTYVVDLLSTEWGKGHFYLGTTPAPGAVFSVSGTQNHTGVITAVDYDKGTITYSDANWVGRGVIQTDVTVSIGQFYQRFTGKPGSTLSFANPTKSKGGIL